MSAKKIIATVAVVALLIGCLFAAFRHMHNEKETLEHNLKTAMDSVQTLKLKNGEHVSVINSYILEKKQLQDYLDISKAEVKELEKKLGKLAYVGDIKTVVKYDTIYTTDTVYQHGPDTLKFSTDYVEKWIALHSNTTIANNKANTVYDKISVPVPLQVGLTNDYRIWVKSKNPYLNITDIEGAVIEGSRINKKQKRWGLGIQGGIGLQYGTLNKKLDVGPYVGVGISYNLITF